MRVKPQVVLAVLSELAAARKRSEQTQFAAQASWLARIRRLRRGFP